MPADKGKNLGLPVDRDPDDHFAQLKIINNMNVYKSIFVYFNYFVEI